MSKTKQNRSYKRERTPAEERAERARMAERLRQRGLAVAFTTLPGLGHGQTLGASLPPLLAQLSAADAEP